MFEKSELTIQIEKTLREANGLVTYERLKAETGRSLDELRSAIARCRGNLERDEGIVYRTVRSVGLERMGDGDKVASSALFTRRIRRAAHGGITRLSAVRDMAALSPADQLRAQLRRRAFDAAQAAAVEDDGGE